MASDDTVDATTSNQIHRKTAVLKTGSDNDVQRLYSYRVFVESASSTKAESVGYSL